VDALSVLRIKQRAMQAAQTTTSSHFVCHYPRARAYLPP